MLRQRPSYGIAKRPLLRHQRLRLLLLCAVAMAGCGGSPGGSSTPPGNTPDMSIPYATPYPPTAPQVLAGVGSVPAAPQVVPVFFSGDSFQASLTTFLNNRQQAEEVLQDVMLTAWTSAATFRGESKVRTWLLVIARRVCADAIRSRRRRRLTLVREDADLEALAGGDGADRVGEGAVVRDLLARLDADRREAFALTQLLGLPYAEAAEVVGCPVGTIRSRVARARADLVEELVERDRAAQG